MIQWKVVSKNKYVLYGFLLLCVLVIVFAIFLRFPFYPKVPADIIGSTQYVTIYKNFTGRDSNIKKILLWTPWFRGWWWLSEAQTVLPTCSYRCDVTKNRAELNTSTAIVFHVDDLWAYRQSVPATLYNPLVPLPKFRKSNQVWVLWSVEPIIHFFGNVPPNMFNWTAHYRRDSTIFMPYASYSKVNDNLTDHKKSVINDFSTKTKMAVTVSSNCRVPSQRYRILRELEKFIQVDEFGVCSGKVMCPKSKGEECDKFIKNYKFYLAFENSYCRDYLTEKVWRVLERNQIPVIAASRTTCELLPENSYLNVFDFPTLESLANKMKEIANNETLYDSYFEWRNHYVKDNEHPFCKLCTALYENRSHQVYHDLEGWIQDDSCAKPSVSIRGIGSEYGPHSLGL